MAHDVKRFSGPFMVFRMRPKGISKRLGGQPLPWFRHATLDEAEAEAARLNDKFPDSTFVVMQQVSRVKRQAVEPAAVEQPATP